MPQKNKVAFISGGASSEARLLAQELLKNGWHIGVTAPENIPEHTVPHCFHAEKANPSDTGELSAAVIRTAETFGGIDSLIYCNIESARYHMILDIDAEEWDRIFSGYLKGFFLACKCAIPYMLGRERASILLLLPEGKEGGVHETARAIAGKQMAELVEKELSPYSLSVKCISLPQKEELDSWIQEETGSNKA